MRSFKKGWYDIAKSVFISIRQRCNATFDS